MLISIGHLIDYYAIKEIHTYLTIDKYLIPPYLMIIMHYNTLTGSVESKFLLIGDLGTNISSTSDKTPNKIH